MNKKHLWWILPLCFIVGLIIGYFFGIVDTSIYIQQTIGNDEGIKTMCRLILN